jgi:hypothetical protein
VVSAAAHNNQSADVVLAMVTSSRSRVQRPGPGDAVIRNWQAAGLRLPSVVRSGRLLVLEHRLVGPILGDLNADDQLGVDVSLRTALGLP